MASPTEKFFDELGRRGHEPLLERITAKVHFHITDGRHVANWLVEIKEGDIRVSRQSGGKGRCGISADRALFDGIVSGEVNAIAAMLRGALWVDGDRETWVLVQRLFPGPCSTRRRPLVSHRSARGDGHE
jgi:putative sterol carrier protein